MRLPMHRKVMNNNYKNLKELSYWVSFNCLFNEDYFRTIMAIMDNQHHSNLADFNQWITGSNPVRFTIDINDLSDFDLVSVLCRTNQLEVCFPLPRMNLAYSDFSGSAKRGGPVKDMARIWISATCRPKLRAERR